MVLKKFLFSGIFFLGTLSLFSQENDYWQKLIQTAFENSEEVNKLKIDFLSTLVSKKQYDYQWFPQLQVSLQGNTNITRGDYIYILNQTSDSALTPVLSPFINFSLYQKLPGQGSLNLSTSYGFNYLPERNLFLQWPQISVSYNQYLGRGAFGIAGNPEYRLVNEQLYYSRLMYKRNLSSQIQEVLSLIQQIDIICAQEDYYDSLVKEYESELLTAQKKESSGMQSSLEAHYAKHQLSEASNNLSDIQYSKKQLLIQINILLPDFSQKDLTDRRHELHHLINSMYESVNKENQSLNKNIYNTLYSSILQQYHYQFQNSEINYAPSLVISSSLSPDGNFYAYYSDWYKSFRQLKETPYPINLTVSIGIQKNFELPGARKLRKEIYNLNITSIENEKQFIQKTQEKQLILLQNQINLDISYISKLTSEIATEQEFREKRKKLLQQNIITKDEFLQSETLYFKIYKDYINTFWNVINNQIAVIDLCSNNHPLIKQFLGENYETNF